MIALLLLTFQGMYHTKPDRSFLNDLQPFGIMQKKYAKHIIEYYENPEDAWFIYVVERSTNKKEITNVSMIIRKDLQQWINHDTALGWKYSDVITS